ncbi:MAG: tyrosine-type recombinase/integrase [Candidatus Melainabacteria bacterium]|nr:tyrosine-type recombinase/integrase [Candidatus Melainabacteria bacterium]
MTIHTLTRKNPVANNTSEKLRRKQPFTVELTSIQTLEAPSSGKPLHLVHPSFSAEYKVSQKNPPKKPCNAEQRSREYLTVHEVEALQTAARKSGRYGHRDATLILIAYRHGLRVGELVDLKWDQVDFESAKIHVNRLKRGDSSVHYLEGDELRALRKLRRDYGASSFIFSTERSGPMSTRTVRDIVSRAGTVAGIDFPVHPHMLRHAKGFQLAGKGIDTRAIQGYLGHRNIQHTVLYTQLSADRFKGFGKD